MMSIPALVEAFNQIIGWPYRLGGTSENGIDCSGAFVRAYELQGQKIYHGSNRIIRVYCNGAFTIERESQLKVGMAVFKQRTDLSRMKAEYKPGGRYYDPALPNDYYHIGLVTGIHPLRIVSATTPVARQDTRLGNWTVAAYLDNVDYEGQSDDPREAMVVAQQGSTAQIAQPDGDHTRARAAGGNRAGLQGAGRVGAGALSDENGLYDAGVSGLPRRRHGMRRGGAFGASAARWRAGGAACRRAGLRGGSAA